MNLTKKSIVAGIVVCGVNAAVSASETTTTTLQDIKMAEGKHLIEWAESSEQRLTPEAMDLDLKLQELETQLISERGIRHKKRHSAPNAFSIWWDNIWSSETSAS